MESQKTEMLPCLLTESEVRERGESAAALHAERKRIEEALEGEKTEAKSKLKTIDLEMGLLMHQIRTKHEDREVAVIYRENLDDATDPRIETVRTDTGELVRSRPMTLDERQGKLLPLRADGASASA